MYQDPQDVLSRLLYPRHSCTRYQGLEGAALKGGGGLAYFNPDFRIHPTGIVFPNSKHVNIWFRHVL